MLYGIRDVIQLKSKPAERGQVSSWRISEARDAWRRLNKIQNEI
jgi:uncharacterized membrane protein